MRLVVPHDPVFQHSRRMSWALRGCGGVRHGSEVADDGAAGDGRKITTRPIAIASAALLEARQMSWSAAM